MKKILKVKNGKLHPPEAEPPVTKEVGVSAVVGGEVKKIKGYKCKCSQQFGEVNEIRRHVLTEGRKEKGKHGFAGRIEFSDVPGPSPSPKIAQPQVTKRYTLRGVMLGVSVSGGLIAIAAFALYFMTQNMVAGAVGVILSFASAISFKYFWDKQDSIKTEHIGRVPTKKVDCLNIYRDEIVFEDFPGTNGDSPKGFLWESDNDHKKYWVNLGKDIRSEGAELTPFVLPDQQYYDPGVFATRVLELPAHRRIFRRREKIGETVKTALLVLTIGIIWILIITTTGA